MTQAPRWPIAVAGLAVVVLVGACGNPERASPRAATSPTRYEVGVDLAVDEEAPFSVTGSRATVNSDAEEAQLQVTFTSQGRLAIEDIRWRYIHDEPDPKIAVGGHGCGYEPDRRIVGCNDDLRGLAVQRDAPHLEPMTVFLTADDPVGTYEFVQPVGWWRMGDQEQEPPYEVVEARPPDGVAEVRVQIDVRTVPNGRPDAQRLS